MRVYIFYRVKNGKGMPLDVPEFYAYTTKKELRDDFIKQRNMEIFYMIKRNVTSDLMKDFENRYKNKELTYQGMYTRHSMIPTEKMEMTVLTTWYEMDVIILKTDIIFTELLKYTSPTIYTLKTEFIKELDALYYLNACRFSLDKFKSSACFFSWMEDFGEEKELVKSNLDYDEFALYMYFMAYTYK